MEREESKPSTDKLSGQLRAALDTCLLSHRRMSQRAPRMAVEASRVVGYAMCLSISGGYFNQHSERALVCHADKIRLDPTDASFCEDVLVAPGELDC